MLCYVMLCYVMLCYVMLCCVVLCCVVLCCVVLCCVVLCCVMLCYVMLCYVMLCYVMWTNCNSLERRGFYHECLFDEQTFCLSGEAILRLLATALYFHTYDINNWK